MAAALLLFSKAPRPGAAKTRLSPALSPDEAAHLAACLATDAIALAASTLPPDGRLVIAYAPDDGRADLKALLPPLAAPPLFLPQRGGDLGERMANAVADAAARGTGPPFVLLGADCPTLPPDAIRAALHALSGDGGADVVLGPAEDGGYYLLGLRGPAVPPGLFDGVVWSTDTVRSRTAANAARLGLRLSADLPPCYDIDTPADLSRLRADLAASPTLRARAPATANRLAVAAPSDAGGCP